MSDLMLFGVLRMPYEMAMGNELSRRQFYDRVQEAADRLEAADRATPPSPSTDLIAAGLRGLAAHVRAVPEYKNLCGDMDVVDKAIAIIEHPPSAASEVGAFDRLKAAVLACMEYDEWRDVPKHLSKELDAALADTRRSAPILDNASSMGTGEVDVEAERKLREWVLRLEGNAETIGRLDGKYRGEPISEGDYRTITALRDTNRWLREQILTARRTQAEGAKDAVRYRWLVENACTGSIGFGDWWINADEPESEWDTAIDAAIAATQKGE